MLFHDYSLSSKEESANLTVESQQDDHNEKEYRPELRKRHHGNCSRVSNECQARTCSESARVKRKQLTSSYFLLQRHFTITTNLSNLIYSSIYNRTFSIFSPESATFDMSVFCSYAMNPSAEKMAKPATKLVPLFRRHKYTQSLKTKRQKDILYSINLCLIYKTFTFFFLQL